MIKNGIKNVIYAINMLNSTYFFACIFCSVFACPFKLIA